MPLQSRSRRYLVFGVSCLLASAAVIYEPAFSQAVQFDTYITPAGGAAPRPPSGLRVVNESDPRRAYRGILAGLASADAQIREAAATQLYQDRTQHMYDSSALLPYLHDTNEHVRDRIVATLLHVASADPFERQSLFPYTTAFHDVYREATSPYLRASLIGLMSLTTVNFDDIEPLVIRAIENGSLMELGNAALAVQQFSPNSIEIYQALSARSSSASYLTAKVVDAMVAIARALSASNEAYYADRLSDGTAALRDRPAFSLQVSYIDVAADQIRENALRVAGASGGNDETAVSIRVDESVSAEVFGHESILVNGVEVSDFRIDRTGGEVELLLSGDRVFQEGVNLVESLAVRYVLWFEDGFIRQFENPYRSSFAIVAAIDEYDDLGTGYQRLGNMVENAKLLIQELERKGFPKENILTLFNSEATSTNIEELLEEFWRGGRYEHADRLVFYFGGHGDYVARDEIYLGSATGFLVTADHEPRRPTATSLLMRDLTSRHFDNIVSKHVLALLDSCSAGLALPLLQSGELTQGELMQFKRYTMIEAEMTRPARNVLVAGTGDQSALYVNGGIFTTFLVEGLRGEADWNGDRVIEFDELDFYVTSSVRARAAMSLVAQEPDAFKATTYGKGSILFFEQ